MGFFGHHHHGHDHDHHHHGAHGHHIGDGHHHGHHHAPASFGRAFALGIILNTAFVIGEASFGFLSNSTALLADAGHNLSDVLGLVMAWVASVLARKRPSKRFTYGLRGSSFLAALFNAVFLLVTAGALSWEAIQRLGHPEPVAGKTVMIVAGFGILINGLTALAFASGRKHDINIRGAFLHMLSDALVSAAVVAAGLGIMFTGQLWLDPVASLLINAVIIWGTWGLLRESLVMSLAAVPSHLDLMEVQSFLAAQPDVRSVHDLHIWPMSTTETALTCHLVMADGHPGDGFLRTVEQGLAARFQIHHPTIQIEVDPNGACTLAPPEVV